MTKVFGGPEGKLAIIPASGSVMHPHPRLCTKPSIRAPAGSSALSIPPNTVRELTFHTHNTAFGDRFDLRIPQLVSSGVQSLALRCYAAFFRPAFFTAEAARL